MPPMSAEAGFGGKDTAVTEWGIQKTMITGLSQNSSNPLEDADSIEDLDYQMQKIRDKIEHGQDSL